jgi:AraC family transcriptional regulator
LSDVETKLETLPRSSAHDLRDRLTFIPPHHEIRGWSKLAPRPNGYTALTFEPDILVEELQIRAVDRRHAPLMYFRDTGLSCTLRKIGVLIREPGRPDRGHLEALRFVAFFQLDRLPHGPLPDLRAPGRLSSGQERLVRDFIEQNLANDITLADLAALVGLSRFHFARIFKATFGQSTRQYISRRRIEWASVLLTTTGMSVAEVATATGFGGLARFSTTFRKQTGVTPSQFRRTLS